MGDVFWKSLQRFGARMEQEPMILAYAVAAGFWLPSSILAWYHGYKAGRKDEPLERAFSFAIAGALCQRQAGYW